MVVEVAVFVVAVAREEERRDDWKAEAALEAVVAELAERL